MPGDLLMIVTVLPMVMVVGVLGLRAPMQTVVPLYAAMVPFGSGFILPIGLPNPFDSLTSIVGLVAVIGLGFHLVFLRTAGTVRPELIAWLLFGAVNGLSFIWSIDRGATVQRVLIVMSLLALYALVSLIPVTRSDLARLRDAIIVGASLACAYGFYLLLTDALPEENAGMPRFATAGGAGDASDPNITAATLVLPIALGLDRALKGGRTSVRFLAGVGTAFMVIGLILTASRGGALGAALAVFVVLAHHHKPLRFALVVLLSLALVFTLTSRLAPEQAGRFQVSDSSGRTDIYQVGWVACQAHCLTGSGSNTFTEVHRQYYLSTPEAIGVRIDEPPHNIWLGVVIELGVAGFATMSVALALTVRSVLKLPRAVRGAPLAGLVGVLTTNMFLGNLYFKYFWLVILYASVAAGVHERRAGSSRVEGSCTAGRDLAVVP